MKQSSSLSTDHNLVDILGKDFVDKSLLSILGFDNTLDTAETISGQQDQTFKSPDFGYQTISTTAQEVSISLVILRWMPIV